MDGHYEAILSEDEITIGWILRDIRIRAGLTLREFCIKKKLDPIRHSLIERNELKPILQEYLEYMAINE